MVTETSCFIAPQTPCSTQNQLKMPEMSLEEARQAMIAKRFGGNANGAKTSDGARRKKKTVHKSAGGNVSCNLEMKFSEN